MQSHVPYLLRRHGIATSFENSGTGPSRIVAPEQWHATRRTSEYRRRGNLDIRELRRPSAPKILMVCNRLGSECRAFGVRKLPNSVLLATRALGNKESAIGLEWCDEVTLQRSVHCQSGCAGGYRRGLMASECEEMQTIMLLSRKCRAVF